MTDQLEINAALKIAKPARDVFEAIVDPERMRNYFIASGTARMETGKTVTWKFPEMDIVFQVHVDRVERDKQISFRWSDFNDGTETRVDIALQPKDDGTLVTIREGSRANDEAGIKWLKSNTEGWANFLACLKAWLEYGINLRKNSFDASQLPDAKRAAKV